MRGVDIQSDLLRNLYIDRKLTIPEIAIFYNCSTSKIWANLRKYNIMPYRAKAVAIPRIDLERLYLTEKLSTRKIANIYICGKSTIESKLRKYNIASRSKSEALKLVPRAEKYKISKEKLQNLYEYKKLSAYKIAEIYDCSPSAISSKLRKLNIPRRTDVDGIILTNDERCRKIAKAVAKYRTKDCNEPEAVKAYLIGFRLGDMNVAKKKYGQTIYVSSCTTKENQLLLMKNLFKKFGHIYIRKSKKNTKSGIIDSFYFKTHLNLSFSFLLDKKDEIKEWILKSNHNFINFLAGYVDAEGSFGVYNGFGSFALGSYDKNIINHIHHKLDFLGIKSEKPRIAVRGGYVDNRGVRTLKDLWSFKIRRKEELKKFVELIEPYLKHLKRIGDLLRVKENVNSRLNTT